MKGEGNIKTLIKENACKDRWYPASIGTFQGHIKLDMRVNGSEELKKNIAYNLQYLQYIQKQLDELHLSSVIHTMLCKSFIIAGMGIVEGLLTNLLKANNRWNVTEWKSIGLIKSNESILDGKRIKIQTELLEKVESYEMRMDLDAMIKKVERKNLLSIEHKNFPILKNLRELRNRIHLQQSNSRTDTDYHNFNLKEKNAMSNILYVFLTDPVFCSSKEPPRCYEFLNVNQESE